MSYLDTSILAAYYCPERLSRKVQGAISRIRQPTISPLVEVELFSALSLKVRSGEMDLAAANQCAAMFRVHLADARYRIVPVGAREYALARQWLGGFNSPLRALDALHLAAAFANDLTLVCADKPLGRSAEQFGVKCQVIA